jgi:signal transduction histidine kinase
LYRYRVRHLLETERIRLAIASDLHDEVATNLSSIAMFSTLVRGELAQPPPLLDRITALATESVAAIREIIWSIDPKPETVASLVVRLRDTMVTSCHARGMDLAVSIEGDGAQRNLTPEQRKNLWLMLKEAVTNAVKHSGATELRVAVAPEGRRVRITVRDNGAGGALSPSSGRGMETMTARAAALGGTATFLSAPGEGTTVEFVVRLAG